jgi:hypothetical protein
MKKLFLTLSIIFFNLLYAQTGGRLIGSHWNGSNEIFTSLDINTKTFTGIDSLPGVHTLVLLQATYDSFNNRYFNITNLGITVINAQTGAIMDTIANNINMIELQYNTNTNKIIGIYWNGSNEILTSLDINTKIFTDIDSLPGVHTITHGKSTFDPFNNRYFIQTNLGITVINAQTGAIMDTIANNINMKELQYNTNTNKIIGTYWNGSNEIFTSLDINTKTFTDIDSLPGVHTITYGRSTFDPFNNRYFIQTNLGITVINAQTGAIIDTIANNINMKGLQYVNTGVTGIVNPNLNNPNLKVYPNPANTHLIIDYSDYTLENKVVFRILNSIGQIVFITPINKQISHLDFSTYLNNGIYFVQLINSHSNIIENKKIVIQK